MNEPFVFDMQCIEPMCPRCQINFRLLGEAHKQAEDKVERLRSLANEAILCMEKVLKEGELDTSGEWEMAQAVHDIKKYQATLEEKKP